MSLLKKMTTFSIIGITFMFLLSVVWNISRNSSLLEGDDWLEAHELRTMNNDRSLPQLNHYTLNDLFKYKDESSLIGLYLTNTNYSGTIGTSVYSLYFQADKTGSYYFYKDLSSTSNRFRFGTTTLEPVPSMSIFNNVNKDSSGLTEYVYSANKGEYIGLYFWNNSNDISMENMLSTIKIYYLPDGYSETDLHQYYELYQYNKGNEARYPYLANLTLNEVFNDNFNDYPGQRTYTHSNGMYLNMHDWSVNGYQQIQNHDLFIGAMQTNSLNTDMKLYRVLSPTFGNSPTLILPSGEIQFIKTNMHDYLKINIYQGLSYSGIVDLTINEFWYIDMTDLGISDVSEQQMIEYYNLYLSNLDNPQDQIYINLQDYNYIEQGSKTINTFLTYWDVIMSTFDTAKWLTDLVIGDSLNSYDYYEYEELYLLWNDNRYYLDPLTQLKYNMILYEKGLYYIVYMDQSSGTHEELLRTVLDYEDLDHYNSQYFWIDKE